MFPEEGRYNNRNLWTIYTGFHHLSSRYFHHHHLFIGVATNNISAHALDDRFNIMHEDHTKSNRFLELIIATHINKSLDLKYILCIWFDVELLWTAYPLQLNLFWKCRTSGSLDFQGVDRSVLISVPISSRSHMKMKLLIWQTINNLT